MQLPEAGIWEACHLHFGTLGDQLATSGTPWRTMQEAGRTRGSLYFGTLLGPYVGSFWALRLEIEISSGLVSRSLFIPILLGRLRLHESRFSYRMYYKNQLAQKSFLWIWRSICFALCFYDFVASETRLTLMDFQGEPHSK